MRKSKKIPAGWNCAYLVLRDTCDAEPHISLFLYWCMLTVFENHRKSLIASEASYVYILSGQKLIQKCRKWSILASFIKPEACGQTVLPERSVLIGQKFMENAKNSNASF